MGWRWRLSSKWGRRYQKSIRNGINGISPVLNFKNPVFMRSSEFEHRVLRQNEETWTRSLFHWNFKEIKQLQCFAGFLFYIDSRRTDAYKGIQRNFKMGIGWEKPVFGWIQKLQIHIFCCPRDSKIRYFLYQGGSLPFCRWCIIVCVYGVSAGMYNEAEVSLTIWKGGEWKWNNLLSQSYC